MQENVFKNILDDDEVVIKQFKPNKAKFYFAVFTIYFIVVVLFSAFGILPFVLDGPLQSSELITLIIVASASIVISVLLVILFANLSYRKKYFAYTNKRILIQSGIIGIDYKGLDHKMIGALEVRVDVVDKIVNKNTGTIKFGSMASPLKGQESAMFVFSGVEDPYFVYREIKKYIDTVKQ